MDEVAIVARIRRWYLLIAEGVDSLRTWPRGMASAYGLLVWQTWLWYTHLSSAERTVDVTAFTTAVFGMATVVASLYLQGGRNWDRLEEIKCSQK